MYDTRMNERTRAYPIGDAQGQHPVPVGNGLGLSHLPGRVRRKKLVREERLRYASWNVGSMTGRGMELADVLKRRRINVACLQETKWKGKKAREIGEGYKFYYCGSDGKRNGVGVVLDRKLKECVTDVKRMSDRIIVVKVMFKNLILNIASVYAPQSGCDDSIKEKFWEDFDAMIMDVPMNEEIFIGGDLNGHVGKVRIGYERVHGGWGFGNRNAEGETILQTANAFDLAVVNTFFQKADQHVLTYCSGNRKTQLDYFLTRRDNLSKVKDCKVIPGEALVTQHRLLVMEVKHLIRTFTTKVKPQPKTRWYLLQNEEYAEKFRMKVISKIKEMDTMEGKSVSDCWDLMAGYVKDVAKNVLGETKGKGVIKKDTWWWNEDVQEALRKKKNSFKMWQKGEECSESMKDIWKKTYACAKQEAKRAVAVARAKAQAELYETLESPSGQNCLYKITRHRERCARDISHVKCMKDERGKVLTIDDDIKGRWKKYFEKLMNEENVWNGQLRKVRSNMGLVNEIKMVEVRVAVKSMKSGKAVGPDDIPVEAWKCLGADGCKWLTLFFNKLLQEEVIPADWCTSILVPIYKNKGDVQECNNYRGIKLMSHSLKIWEKVIEKRLRDECEITQNQFGFMPGRRTTDAIFALRQVCETYRRARRSLHMVFVDLEKAYDRIPREVLWWSLKEKGVPGKYVELIRAMYFKISTQVRSAAGTTDSFTVAVGLHQGSALSPYLFLLVMDALTSDLQEEAPWCMLFADDIVLVDEDGARIRDRLESWRQRLENVGLRISRTKTVHMYCDFGGLSNPCPVALDGSILPVCPEFQYLGSLFQADGDVDRDVKRRISSGWMKWRQVTGTICDPRISLKLKGNIYKSMIRPVVMYGSECWPVKRMDEQRLHVCEMRMLRWMCGVTRQDRVRNEYIRGSLKVAPIVEKLREKRLSWYGHVVRRDKGHITRKVIDMKVDGRAGRGRPKKRWMDCVKEDMLRKGVSSELASDRREWKRKTCCADPK